MIFFTEWGWLGSALDSKGGGDELPYMKQRDFPYMAGFEISEILKHRSQNVTVPLEKGTFLSPNKNLGFGLGLSLHHASRVSQLSQYSWLRPFK